MDVINLLPSPPHFFRLFFRLALSLFNSTFNANHYRTIAERRPHMDFFNLDSETGFFPPQPLPRLPEMFDIWEHALAEANGNLCLGDDDREEANSKRLLGETFFFL